MSMPNRLREWGRSRDNDYSGSVDDLEEVDLVDVLRDIAEHNHLDEAVAHAFDGAQEERMELADIAARYGGTSPQCGTK